MENYINRDFSWMEFNKRVLFQATRTDIPLMERFNFLSITGSNMDEFLMVRFSDLLDRVSKNKIMDINGIRPIDEYKMILKSVRDFKQSQTIVEKMLKKELFKKNIHLVKFTDLDKSELNVVKNIFHREIFPLLSPISYDTTKEFPELLTKQPNIVVAIEGKDGNELLTFIALHRSLKKIYRVSNDKNTKIKYISLQEIIYGMLNDIFVGKSIKSKGMMKLYRDNSIELEIDRSVYLLDRMKDTLLKKEFSQPIYIDFSSDTPDKMVKLVRKIFEIDKECVWDESPQIDYSIYNDLDLSDPSLYYKPFNPQFPVELIGEQDMFTAIDNNDILLHHPYDSFDPVIEFINHASMDKDTVTIRQTLYRVSSKESEIVNALCNASKNGIQVLVLIELKARFDEKTNISLIDKLKNSGCKLIFGDDVLKTHCKFISVVKKTNKGYRIYTHMGTGNYNEKTSKIYTDLSYFTSNYKIGYDIIKLFHTISGVSDEISGLEKVSYSPYNLRSTLYKNIDREIELAQKGKEANVTIKINSLSDKEFIDKLYRASKHGVKINIFVRGICSIKAINKNIKIRSVIGRFLEHSRIYHFYNNGDPKVYISSADLLTRNLDHRFETLIPIVDDECKEKINKILGLHFIDEFNSFKMDKNGWFKFKGGKFNMHKFLMDEAIANYKLKSAPKMTGKKKKKK